MVRTLIPFETTRYGLFDDVRREMDGLLGHFFGGNGGTEGAQWHAPAANFSETEKAYEVSLDVPGLKPEDFNVELRQGELWITGERKEHTEEQDRKWHRVETRFGQFRRVFRLGNDVDSANVEASYKDGVLHISVPKSQESQTRKITVK